MESEALKILTETKWFLCGVTTVQEFRLHGDCAVFLSSHDFFFSLTFTLTFGDIETIIVFLSCALSQASDTHSQL